ncbi:unnamed protein product, partial [Oppiella nova]
MIADTKSKVVALFVYLKKLSEKWFSHVLLLAFLILYACMGAWIFESVEGGYEKEQNAIVRQLRVPVDNLTDKLTKRLWNERLKYPLPGEGWQALDVDSRWDAFARKALAQFETQVSITCKQ